MRQFEKRNEIYASFIFPKSVSLTRKLKMHVIPVFEYIYIYIYISVFMYIYIRYTYIRYIYIYIYYIKKLFRIKRSD